MPRKVPWAPLGWQELYGLQEYNQLLPPLSPGELNQVGQGQSTEPPLPSAPWANRVVGPKTQLFNEMNSNQGRPPYPGAAALDEWLRRQLAQQQQFENQLWQKGYYSETPDRTGGPGVFGGIPRGGGY
jgi:hypothetical protein